jgi:P pilus assembly chaperone PapD
MRHSIVLAVLAISVWACSPASWAADVKMIAKVTEVQLAADGKSAVVKLSNVKDGSAVTVKVSDLATLDKLAAKTIHTGDQVRLSYDPTGGTNLSKTFKKAEGC